MKPSVLLMDNVDILFAVHDDKVRWIRSDERQSAQCWILIFTLAMVTSIYIFNAQPYGLPQNLARGVGMLA
jgi:hypothetical protein